MTKEKFIALVGKFNSGECSENEQQIIIEFVKQLQEKGNPYSWELGEEEQTKINLLTKVNARIDKLETQKERNTKSFNYLWRVAAAVLILMGVGVAYYSFQNSFKDEVEYITKTTTRGQKLTITLADGSKINLNAKSSITFPKTFANATERNVSLLGEAFFEVTKNPKKPFKVTSGGSLTTVLGTSFNISAYPNEENTTITVATGKVSVVSKQNPSNFQMLVPGEQANLNRKTSLVTKSKVEIAKYASWKDGVIILDNTTLEKTTEILSRWYDVTFHIANDDIKNRTVSGKFKNDQLKNILQNLSILMDIDFQIEKDSTITIKQKSQ